MKCPYMSISGEFTYIEKEKNGKKYSYLLSPSIGSALFLREKSVWKGVEKPNSGDVFNARVRCYLFANMEDGTVCFNVFNVKNI